MNLTQAQARIKALVISRLGYPYVYGAAGPTQFDCSGLTLWVANQAGINISSWEHGSAWQFYSSPAPRVTPPLEVGDYIFMRGGETYPPYPGHVGIVVNPADNLMIDAPYTGVDVRYDNYSLSANDGVLSYYGATRPALLLTGNVPIQEPTLYLTSPYMFGPPILRCQQRLIIHGFKLALGKSGADSVFGPDTEQAVKDFQSSVHITVDGICGPITWAKLNK